VYTISADNWAGSGATWQGMTNDASDKYQAAIHACRMYNIPISIAINSMGSVNNMQDELDLHDNSWEPAVHTRTHPCTQSAYEAHGYEWEILGCRDDILNGLTNISYGNYIFEFILPCGYPDATYDPNYNNPSDHMVWITSSEEFLFLRAWIAYTDNLWSTDYASWNSTYKYYYGMPHTKGYDNLFGGGSSAVTELNTAFDTVYNNHGVFSGVFHPSSYSNSVIYSSGSVLMQHLSHVANRKDVWYPANGWMYSYRMVAENALVLGEVHYNHLPMTIVNNDENTYAYCTIDEFSDNTNYFYKVIADDAYGNSLEVPAAPHLRSFTFKEPVPVLFNPIPDDKQLNIGLNPALSIYAEHPTGNLMNISFRTNASGVWVTIGSNISVGIGTYSCHNTVDMNQYNTWYWWSVNCTDETHWKNQTFSFKTELQSSIWWDSNWLYRKEIAINHTKVTADLTNFPVLINFPSDADLASKAQDDGDDLVFTDYYGNQLNHEIELFNGSSGQLVAWVNVTSLSSTVDTVLYLYYGNAGCGSQQNVAGVWDSGYRMVQHLDETSGTHYDSTSFGNDGTCSGGVNQNAVGKVDGADEFDGTNDYIDTPLIINGSKSNNLTAECWVRLDTTTKNWQSILDAFDNGAAPGDRRNFQMFVYNDQKVYVWHNGQAFTGTGSLNPGTWYYFVYSYQANSDLGYLYINGNLMGNVNVPAGKPSNIQLDIGRRTDGDPSGYTDGIIDEVRISDKARNASWINTSFLNQYNPNVFYTVDSEELGVAPDEPVLSIPMPANNAMNVVLNPLLSIHVEDQQGDTMNVDFRTNASGVWATIGSNISVDNGTYSCHNTVDMNQYNTWYWWSVNATDPMGSKNWANETFMFMTKINNTPVLSGENPSNGSASVSVTLPSLQVIINDPEGDRFNWTIQTRPHVGSSYGNNEGNGSKFCTILGLTDSTTYTWFVNVTDRSGSGKWTNKTYYFTTSSQPMSWWNTNWLYRKQITIDHTKVAGNLTNFPVLINFSSDANLASKAQDDGDDLVFTDYSGAKLNHEIEVFNGGTGQLVCWVNITGLSSTTDTVLYLYYGNAVCGSQQNVAGVWDSGYRMVQHLGETSGLHYDSTSFGNDGTCSGGVRLMALMNLMALMIILTFQLFQHILQQFRYPPGLKIKALALTI
jgi:hypothetical protein